MVYKPPPANRFPRRGEVYLLQLDKPRPAVVLSLNELNRQAFDVCVVGITTRRHVKFRMRVPLDAGEGGLNFQCWAKCDQVTTLAKNLLRYPALGTLSFQSMAKIEEQVKVALGLG
jgi:mRNA-degrading endonuclease toxin of MazEF toxin-antitoxin module